MSLTDEMDCIFEQDYHKRGLARLRTLQYRQLNARGWTNDQLAKQLENNVKNLTCHCTNKVLTYEWALVNVFLPEVIRRLSKEYV